MIRKQSMIETDYSSSEDSMTKTSNGLSISDNYVYTQASTDVTIRWRKLYGWVPPTEDPKFLKKWADFRVMTAQGIESIGRPAPQFNPSVVNYKKKGSPDT